MLTVTDSAVPLLQDMLKDEPGCKFRILVSSSCGGPDFNLALDESTNKTDMTPIVNGVAFIYPEHVAPYLDGVIIDAVEKGNGRLGLVIRSPIRGECCSSSGHSGCSSTGC
jgi:Fe-S cluster assembly iron-binding protein IscA